jgi:hypothetical protein
MAMSKVRWADLLTRLRTTPGAVGADVRKVAVALLASVCVVVFARMSAADSLQQAYQSNLDAWCDNKCGTTQVCYQSCMQQNSLTPEKGASALAAADSKWAYLRANCPQSSDQCGSLREQYMWLAMSYDEAINAGSVPQSRLRDVEDRKSTACKILESKGGHRHSSVWMVSGGGPPMTACPNLPD